jgi:hypothetical protein
MKLLGIVRCYYYDRLEQSVSPLLYRLNPNQINNCESCLSVFGPRAGHNGVGDSTAINIHATAPAQGLVDVESILSNRNVIASKCKDGKVNDIDVTKFQLQHARICNDFLDPLTTHLTNPPQNYRGISIDRFYDLPTNPQSNVFYPWAVNSTLEARDNYKERIEPLILFDPTLPEELQGNGGCRNSVKMYRPRGYSNCPSGTC